ncbi:MAG: glycoside hydrolase family 3 protein [Acidimicrobiia bacterium]|nr:glycoside hydrolase family 3 protein [Acidimicrobiia bacterium]
MTQCSGLSAGQRAVGTRDRYTAWLLGVALIAAGCSSDTDPGPSTSTTAVTSAPSTTAVIVTKEAVYLDPDASIEERVDDLIGRMTLSEKIAQMALVQKSAIAEKDLTELGIGALLSGGGEAPEDNTPEGWAAMVRGFQDRALESRLGIPVLYGIDAVHGHNNVPGAVIFPHNIGLGAADDPALMEEIGRITALEMVATGIYWNYAPAVSVPQDIRWGRTYEGYSENTERVTALATPYIRGLQGGDLTEPTSVLATPKHFVGDGGTVWGTSRTASYWIDQGVTEADEATLRAIHLPPYPSAIDEGALSIMASYSSWGGEKMHAQEHLLTDVLKSEFGFEGFVVSDWGAIDQISDDYYESVVRSVNAGIDMNMIPGNYPLFISELTAAVEAGEVTEERIDDAVRRILRAKLTLGLFENPYGDDALLADVGSDEHRAVAREAVARSQVLLKNENDLLPLDPEMPELYVAGQHADDIGLQSGGWSIEWQGGVGDITEGTSILEGIRATVSRETSVVYDRAGEFEGADFIEGTVCLAVVGEQPYAEGVGTGGD